MHVVILGCGALGLAVARRLVAAGHSVIGVRRQPLGNEGVPMLASDIADAGLWQRLPPCDAALLCANPGLRRGRDNGLAQGVAGIPAAVRVVYTGSTAVYADLGGGGADEAAPVIDGDAAVAGLLAIEHAVLQRDQALVLRVTALVGPGRDFAAGRVAAAAGGTVTIKGDPDRPFSWLHEDDAAEVCVEALVRPSWVGVFNAAAPGRMRVRDYYQHLAQRQGVTVHIVGDASLAPSRWIDARRLHALMGPRPWLDP